MEAKDDPTTYAAKVDAGGGEILDDRPGEVFPWWSFSKSVIAACALRLVARGALELDEVLPSRPWTLRQLVQHRAGVSNYGRLLAYHEAVTHGDTPWTVAEMLDRVGPDLDFEPGRGWAYSNVGYFYVRRIIEETTNAEIGDAVRQLVLDPLDLESVSLAREPDDLTRTVWGNPGGYHPEWVYHGLLIGTAMDAVRFLAALTSGTLLPGDLLATMRAAHPLGGAIAGRPWETAGYGLGLMIGQMTTVGLAIGHSGVGPDTVSAVYWFPDCHPQCLVAAFARGSDECIPEHAAARLATQT